MLKRKLFGFLAAMLFASPLTAAAPEDASACPEPEAHQFDFWIGEWDVINKTLQEDGSWKEAGRATNRVYPVLDGCAIVEHWEGTFNGRPLYGFSIRAFDPESKQWVLLLNWPSPNRPVFGRLQGVFTLGRGEFFSSRRTPNGKEMQIRYSFADVSPQSFRWDASRSEDGQNWLTHWIMEFRRRPAGSLPLFNGPTTLSPQWQLCRGEEFRQFDFLTGRWQGTSTRSGQESPARLHVLPILQGCAVMEFGEEEPSGKVFRIRAFDPSSKQWVLYRIDTRRRIFETARGKLEEGKLELVGPRHTSQGRMLWKVVWSGMESRTPLRETFLSSDDGKTWQADATLVLKMDF